MSKLKGGKVLLTVNRRHRKAALAGQTCKRRWYLKDHMRRQTEQMRRKLGIPDGNYASTLAIGAPELLARVLTDRAVIAAHLPGQRPRGGEDMSSINEMLRQIREQRPPA